jgi:hypothetical protein
VPGNRQVIKMRHEMVQKGKRLIPAYQNQLCSEQADRTGARKAHESLKRANHEQ